MPRPCTICNHPKRRAIDELLVSGEPNRRIASQFDVSEASIRRHKDAHLPAKLVKAEAAKEEAEATSLLDRIKTLVDRSENFLSEAEKVLADARESQNPKTALAAIKTAGPIMRELRGLLELLGRVTGELGKDDQNTVGPGAVIILPEKLPPGAPCITDKQYWIDRGFPEPDVEVLRGDRNRALPEPGGRSATESEVIDAEVVEC